MHEEEGSGGGLHLDVCSEVVVAFCIGVGVAQTRKCLLGV